MKWLNHQIVTGFIVAAATDDAIFTASAIVGAVLPDRLEGSPPKESSAYWKWRRNHRTWSHWPPLYIIPIVAAQIAKKKLPRIRFRAEFVDVRTYRGAFAHCRGRALRQSTDFNAARQTRAEIIQSRHVAGIFFRRADYRNLPVRSFRKR